MGEASAKTRGVLKTSFHYEERQRPRQAPLVHRKLLNKRKE